MVCYIWEEIMNRHYMTAILAASMALVVPLQSCDDEDDDISVSSVCGDFCSQFQDCYGESGFDETFSSRSDCIDECEDGYGEVEEEVDSNCGSLYLDYLDCVYNLDCNDLEDEYEDPGSECDSEWDNLEDECDAIANNCTEDNMQVCFELYEMCVDYIDPMSDNYMEELEACLSSYCQCLDSLGCDLSESGCEEYL